MLYDVQVMGPMGVWRTDLTTGSRRRAQDRYKYLLGHIVARIIDSDGRQVFGEGV